MPADLIWLGLDDVVELNRLILSGSPEPHLLLDEGKLSSAIASPQNLAQYEGQSDLVVLAVTLLEKIGRAHAFQQGNKRTAFYAAAVFLERNDAIFAPPDDQMTASWIEALIERRLNAMELVSLLRPFIVLPD